MVMCSVSCLHLAASECEAAAARPGGGRQEGRGEVEVVLAVSDDCPLGGAGRGVADTQAHVAPAVRLPGAATATEIFDPLEQKCPEALLI